MILSHSRVHFLRYYTVSPFFVNATATPEIYTLSLHDALPTSSASRRTPGRTPAGSPWGSTARRSRDRKSTRLNSSHVKISYAVFCLKKKTALRGDRHHRRAGAAWQIRPGDGKPHHLRQRGARP